MNIIKWLIPSSNHVTPKDIDKDHSDFERKIKRSSLRISTIDKLRILENHFWYGHYAKSKKNAELPVMKSHFVWDWKANRMKLIFTIETNKGR